MKIRSVFVLLVVAYFVTGCAGLPEIPYDRMSAGQIKTIGIVTPSIPKGASVILATSVGQSFGLVGALVDVGLQANRESHFKTIMEQQNFSVPDAFLDHLKTQLETRGYTVSTLSVTRSNTKFLDKYPENAGVDAYLDVVVTNYGYISAGIGASTPYRPQFLLQARLVSAKNSSLLMQDTIFYNPVGPFGANTKSAVTISPTAAYEFTDFDRLEANPQTAVEGLRDAVYLSADNISSLLK